MENPSDTALDMINDAIITDKPEIDIENTGIGAYEYWGAVGFDHGQDIPYVVEETRTVKIPRDGFSDDDIKETVFELLAKTHTVTILHETKYDSEPMELSYKIDGVMLTESTIDFLITWNEIIG
jgi:hypothetical protein